MKIIGKLEYALNSESQALGHLAYPSMSKFVVCENDTTEYYVKYGIYELVPVINHKNEIYVEYHPRVTGKSLEIIHTELLITFFHDLASTEARQFVKCLVPRSYGLDLE